MTTLYVLIGFLVLFVVGLFLQLSRVKKEMKVQSKKIADSLFIKREGDQIILEDFNGNVISEKVKVDIK